MNELGPKQQTATGMSPNKLILSQLINIVPISKYSLNATMFHYGLAIRTESYKIDKIHEFKTCGLTGC